MIFVLLVIEWLYYMVINIVMDKKKEETEKDEE